ncbi:helix-turn-helix domain-containing protein [Streptomyces fagopyri]
MRARMIELSWSGLRVPAIAGELGCSQKTVRCYSCSRLALLHRLRA